MYPMIDTHTHFDVDCFDHDREKQSILAYQSGVYHIVLVGFLAKHFRQMVNINRQMVEFTKKSLFVPKTHLSFGLHPFYITEHSFQDLAILENFIKENQLVAIGEIGLDTFTEEMKFVDNYRKQQNFFIEQLNLAKNYNLPVLLHVRKSHADVIKILKNQKFTLGGIAHSFSGGIQEAKQFVKLGFKIGITGQVTNPNAKKLRKTMLELVKSMGLDSIVIETDCPDMTPLACHASHQYRNVPANLIFVFNELSQLLNIDKVLLSKKLWQNSISALQTTWQYPYEKS